jgi:hypothetical protein
LYFRLVNPSPMKRLLFFLPYIILFCILISWDHLTCAASPFIFQKDSITMIQRRLTTLKIVGGVVYVGSLAALYQFEYKNNLQSHFQIKTYQKDWRMRMDATHHATAAYHIGRMGFDLMRWAGFSEKRSTWLGGLSGFVMLTSQEILDGFDSKWYASISDLATNTFGPALFISQQLLWHDQRIMLKWSYHKTSFPEYDPQHLGTSVFQKMIKDYNGQTFWLSANLRSFRHGDSHLPRWLNIAAGLGITGITGPVPNPPLYRSYPLPESVVRHLFFIAPDIDLSRIHTRSAALKWVFEALGFLKIPFPALEFGRKGVKCKSLYF